MGSIYYRAVALLVTFEAIALIPSVVSTGPFGMDMSDLADMPHLGPLGILLMAQKTVQNGEVMKKLFCGLEGAGAHLYYANMH